MSNDAAQVTVSIEGGPSTPVDWNDTMTAQDALESAWNAFNSTAKFTYALQYYGKALGYMVFMVNETYDSFLSTAEPYFYWEFLVNGKAQNQGIDGTELNAGDEVTFTYTRYIPEKHAGTTLEAKNQFQKSRLA
jgi:hypothetical protein